MSTFFKNHQFPPTFVKKYQISPKTVNLDQILNFFQKNPFFSNFLKNFPPIFQIQDVTVRVESIRHFSVSQMALLVENAHVLLAGSAQQRSNMCEVLLAAAWICGEYSQ